MLLVPRRKGFLIWSYCSGHLPLFLLVPLICFAPSEQAASGPAELGRGKDTARLGERSWTKTSPPPKEGLSHCLPWGERKGNSNWNSYKRMELSVWLWHLLPIWLPGSSWQAHGTNPGLTQSWPMDNRELVSLWNEESSQTPGGLHMGSKSGMGTTHLAVKWEMRKSLSSSLPLGARQSEKPCNQLQKF